MIEKRKKGRVSRYREYDSRDFTASTNSTSEGDSGSHHSSFASGMRPGNDLFNQDLEALNKEDWSGHIARFWSRNLNNLFDHN